MSDLLLQHPGVRQMHDHLLTNYGEQAAVAYLKIMATPQPKNLGIYEPRPGGRKPSGPRKPKTKCNYKCPDCKGKAWSKGFSKGRKDEPNLIYRYLICQKCGHKFMVREGV